MTIIKIEKNSNGSHDNQTIHNVNDEAFWVSPDVATPELLEERGYAHLRFETVDGKKTLVGWTPFPVQDGWAFLPKEVGTPQTLENYPFGDVTVEKTVDVDGESELYVVTSWTPLPMPEPEPEPEPEPTQLDRVEAQATYTAMMTDTMLEV